MDQKRKKPALHYSNNKLKRKNKKKRLCTRIQIEMLLFSMEKL